MKTYNDVAKETNLPSAIAERFIAYMRLRWGDPKDEDLKCRVGYAQEWAERFKAGVEYEASDNEGRRILKDIVDVERGK